MQSLRESGPLLAAFDVACFAASTDKPEKNRKFAESLQLDFPILSDPGKGTARDYGVLRAGLFAARHTIYIGRDGKVLLVDREIRSSTAGSDMVTRFEQLGVPPDFNRDLPRQPDS